MPHAASAGTLAVMLAPPEAVAAGAQWRLAGETVWRDSNTAYAGLAVGLYLLEYRAVSGWIEPRTPEWVRISAGVSVVLGPGEYQPLPAAAVTAIATAGGIVSPRVWEPTGTQGLWPPGVDGSDDSLNREWVGAVRTGPRPVRMPRENIGMRVRLHAVPAAGYRFAGWAGSGADVRNPRTLILEGPRTVQAVFERVAPGVVASQGADGYLAGGVVTLHCQFNYAPGDRLESLVWRPALPAGWTVLGVDGLGTPVIEGGQIRFQGPLGFNPVVFNLRLAVPPGETGAKRLGGTVEWTLAGEAGVIVRPVQALSGGPELELVPVASPAARLEFELTQGRPVLVLHGLAGRRYVIERAVDLGTALGAGSGGGWLFLRDVRVSLPPARLTDIGSGLDSLPVFFRATLLD